MALTNRQSTLVRGSIPFLREHGERISTIVYRNLLDRYPDLNNTFNIIHQKDGRLARALTVVILRFASNISNIAELIPKLERVCNKHVTLGVQPEHYKVVGELIIEGFEVVMGPDFTPELKAAWVQAYAVLSRMLMGRETHIYRKFRQVGWTTMRRMRVERKIAETRDDDIISFYLVPVDTQAPHHVLPRYLPGQFVTVKVNVQELGYTQTRQYSLSDSPGKPYFRITVKRDIGQLYKNSVSTSYTNPGLVSNLLIDQIYPGQQIEVSHPSGDFFLDTDNPAPDTSPVVLISAGSGVVPMVAILNAIAENQPLRPVTWIQGTRHEAPFLGHVRKVEAICPNLARMVFKTRVGKGDVAGVTYDYEGRIDIVRVIADLHLMHGSTEYFLCGPEEFMREKVAELAAVGVDRERIKCELYSVGDMQLDSVKAR